jgi:hypothetical protein
VTVRVRDRAGAGIEALVAPGGVSAVDLEGDLLVTLDRLDLFEVRRLSS